MRTPARLFWLLILVAGTALALAACGDAPSPKPQAEEGGRGLSPIDFNELQQDPTFADKPQAEPKAEPKGEPKAEPKAARAAPQGAVANDARFHEALLAAAAGYEAFGNVDDIMRWAPGLCRAPPKMQIRQSKSADAGTHGRKLYWLFAKDRAAYVAAASGAAQPVGQVLVKEAWTSREATADEVAQGHVIFRKPAEGGHRFETPTKLTIERDGKHWTPAGKEALFVMLKLDPATEGSDGGWVYGTLTPDGKTVTSAGRVASCMRCHVKAEHDRMFGL